MHIAYSIYHKLWPINNFKFSKVGNIKLILHSLDNRKDEKGDLKQRRENVRSSSYARQRIPVHVNVRSSSYARQLIPVHVNDPEFIYRVNFEAGKG